MSKLQQDYRIAREVVIAEEGTKWYSNGIDGWKFSHDGMTLMIYKADRNYWDWQVFDLKNLVTPNYEGTADNESEAKKAAITAYVDHKLGVKK